MCLYLKNVLNFLYLDLARYDGVFNHYIYERWGNIDNESRNDFDIND